MPVITVGRLIPEQTKLNQNGEERWIRGYIQLHSSFHSMLFEIGQRKLPFTIVTRSVLPRTNAIILGEITSYTLDSGREWKTLEIKKLIQTDSPLLQAEGISFREAVRRIQENDQEFLDLLGSSELRVQKLLSDLVGTKNQFVNRMMELFKEEAYHKLVENPWRMINMIPYFTIKQADAVAEKLGIPLSDKRRFHEYFRYLLDQAFQNQKNTYLTENEFIALYWMHFSEELSLDEYKQLAIMEDTPIKKTDIGYHPAHFYYAERASYHVIRKSLKTRIPNGISEFAAEEAIRESDIVPTEEQVHAIKGAFQTPLHIITGGPGTGKTTVLRLVIQKLMKLLDMPLWYEGSPFLLMAPTGKAAYRMWEQTGIPAHTIHSAFRIIPEYGCIDIEETAKALSHVQYIVIDEASMLDTTLFGDMCQIMLAMDHIPFLLLVGDIDQLPPVQPGQVFKDIMDFLLGYAREQVSMLTVLKRQANGSHIPELASFIKNGLFPDASWFEDKDDIFFVPTTMDALPDILYHQVLLPKQEILDSIQLITPYRNGSTPDTIHAMNALVEPLYNPCGNNPDIPEITCGNQIIHIGDKVINRVNRTEKIINGSVGYVTAIYNNSRDVFDWSIDVSFDGEIENYMHKDFKQLELAYAITVHASQGSEYENVVISMVRGSNNSDFLNQNLLYVAATRAQKKLVLMGQISTFRQVAATKQRPRYTALGKWLKSNV